MPGYSNIPENQCTGSCSTVVLARRCAAVQHVPQKPQGTAAAKKNFTQTISGKGASKYVGLDSGTTDVVCADYSLIESCLLACTVGSRRLKMRLQASQHV